MKIKNEKEPVVWVTQRDIDTLSKTSWPYLDGVRLFKINYANCKVPLFTHAGPAEVESLRAENGRLEESAGFWGRATARMQAERDAAERKLEEAMGLLRESDNWVRVLRTQFGYSQTKELAERIDALLSAIAEENKD